MAGDVATANLFLYEKHKADRNELNLPNTLYSHESVLLGGKIYVFGGHMNSFVYALDYTKKRWEALAFTGAYIRRCRGHTATLVDDDVFIIGGLVQGFTRRAVLSFNFVFKDFDFVSLRGLGLGLSGLEMVGHVAEYFPRRREILIYGKELTLASTRCKLFGFYPSSSLLYMLQAKGHSPGDRKSFVSCAAGNAMFVYAGDRARGIFEHPGPAALFILLLYAKDLTWTKLSPSKVPFTARFASLSYVPGRLFLYGGRSSSNEVAALSFFDIQQKSWHNVQFSSDYSQANSSSWSCIVNTSSYVRLPNCHTTTYVSGKLLVIGGYSEDMYEYSTISETSAV